MQREATKHRKTIEIRVSLRPQNLPFRYQNTAQTQLTRPVPDSLWSQDSKDGLAQTYLLTKLSNEPKWYGELVTVRVRNPTTLGNADFLSGAVPAHGLIPPPPFLGSSEAFPVHGTWNAYTPLPATTHSCRKIEPPPPTRDATQTWPYILVGWCPPSPAGYGTPPPVGHTPTSIVAVLTHTS